MRVLSPAVVAAITDLELAARLVVEGLRAGGHRSPFHGFNAEFQQHRPYRAGDDLKHLDWKILARTDRLYSRQFRETTNMPVMIVIDTSASMGFDDGGVSKLRHASVAAAALAYLISSQGDAVGLMAHDGERPIYLPARGGRVHMRALIARIDALEARGAWDPVRTIARGAELLGRKGVVLVLSDFYDAEEETQRQLRRVLRRGHDAAMLQVLTQAEISFPYNDSVELEDSETGARRLVGSARTAQQYRDDVAAFIRRTADNAARDGVDYAMLATDHPLQTTLRAFLLRRGAHHQEVHAPLHGLA
jgi:uncharacterized protein (DUF58 family)